MQKFVLLLDEDPNAFQDISAAQMQEVLQAYEAWAGNLAAQGRLHGGLKLDAEGGRVIAGTGASQTVTDGPYSEAKEVIAGFFIIGAADYDEAVALVSDCPHLRFGGTIRLRRADPNLEG